MGVTDHYYIYAQNEKCLNIIYFYVIIQFIILYRILVHDSVKLNDYTYCRTTYKSLPYTSDNHHNQLCSLTNVCSRVVLGFSSHEVKLKLLVLVSRGGLTSLNVSGATLANCHPGLLGFVILMKNILELSLVPMGA